MSKISQHVFTSDDGRWSVKKAGAVKASRTFSTREDAIAYGRNLARTQNGELYIHRKDGKISGKISYSKGSYPAKTGK